MFTEAPGFGPAPLSGVIHTFWSSCIFHDFGIGALVNYLNSVSEGHVLFISSRSRVYCLKDGDPVGLSASRSVGFPKWTVLIGGTGFDTIHSIPDPTLGLNHPIDTYQALLIEPAAAVAATSALTAAASAATPSKPTSAESVSTAPSASGTSALAAAATGTSAVAPSSPSSAAAAIAAAAATATSPAAAAGKALCHPHTRAGAKAWCLLIHAEVFLFSSARCHPLVLVVPHSQHLSHWRCGYLTENIRLIQTGPYSWSPPPPSPPTLLSPPPPPPR